LLVYLGKFLLKFGQVKDTPLVSQTSPANLQMWQAYQHLLFEDKIGKNGHLSRGKNWLDYEEKKQFWFKKIL